MARLAFSSATCSTWPNSTGDSMAEAISATTVSSSMRCRRACVFPVYRDSDCAGIFGVWERAHNLFLEGFLGLGLPFVAALTIGYLILVGVFIRGIRIRRQFRFIPIMGLAVLILASLHSIVDFSLQIPGVGVYFAAVMAAATTVSLGRGRE